MTLADLCGIRSERLFFHCAGRPMQRCSGGALRAKWQQSTKMPAVNRAYNKVRDEVAEVGLLYEPQDGTEDGYRDQIRAEVALLPSLGETGFVYESTSFGWSCCFSSAFPAVTTLGESTSTAMSL